MKLLDSERHYISEYYIRKGYIVVWKGTTTPLLQLTKRGSPVKCDKVWSGGLTIREFIENVDIYLHSLDK